MGGLERMPAVLAPAPASPCTHQLVDVALGQGHARQLEEEDRLALELGRRRGRLWSGGSWWWRRWVQAAPNRRLPTASTHVAAAAPPANSCCVSSPPPVPCPPGSTAGGWHRDALGRPGQRACSKEGSLGRRRRTSGRRFGLRSVGRRSPSCTSGAAPLLQALPAMVSAPPNCAWGERRGVQAPPAPPNSPHPLSPARQRSQTVSDTRRDAARRVCSQARPGCGPPAGTAAPPPAPPPPSPSIVCAMIAECAGARWSAEEKNGGACRSPASKCGAGHPFGCAARPLPLSLECACRLYMCRADHLPPPPPPSSSSSSSSLSSCQICCGCVVL